MKTLGYACITIFFAGLTTAWLLLANERRELLVYLWLVVMFVFAVDAGHKTWLSYRLAQLQVRPIRVWRVTPEGRVPFTILIGPGFTLACKACGQETGMFIGCPNIVVGPCECGGVRIWKCTGRMKRDGKLHRFDGEVQVAFPDIVPRRFWQ